MAEKKAVGNKAADNKKAAVKAPAKGGIFSSRNFKGDIITIAVLVIAYFIISNLKLSSLMTGLLVPVCVYIIMAMSLNLTVGILGELSLGHAGFMCVGAFTGVIFSRLIQSAAMPELFKFILSILVATVVGAIFGIIIGIPVLRLNGDYLAIVTLAFGEIIKALLNNLYVGKTADGSIEMNMSGFKNVTDSAGKFVSGPLGLTKIPKYATFEIAVVMVVLVYIICSHFIHSRDGRAVMAIRDNRIAAESVGINITKYKMIAFVLSSAMAGAAGCLYAHNYATLQAVKFDYNKSILILVFVVLGGIGNIKGSIVSAIILTLLPELLRGIGNYRMLIYSILLIVIMLINWSPKSRVVVQRLGAKIKGIFVKEKAAV